MNCYVFPELFEIFKLSFEKITDFTHFSGGVHLRLKKTEKATTYAYWLVIASSLVCGIFIRDIE